MIDLAHESGHAVHSRLNACQPDLNRDVSEIVCETAAILGEELLTRTLIETHPERRLALLDKLLANTWMNLTRQIDFARFEVQAHDLVAKNATVEELSAAYLEGLRRQFGPRVSVDEIFKDEWLYVSHMFSTPFYCYSYGIGKLLSLAIYSRLREEGQGFAEKYLDSLRAGGSVEPEDLFKRLGLDLNERSTWQTGWDMIRLQIEEYRACVEALETRRGSRV